MIAVIVLGLFSFGVSLLTLFSGFGLGTLLMPAFALFLPVEVTVASTAIVHAATTSLKWAFLPGPLGAMSSSGFGLPAILASFVGAIVLTSLSEQTPLTSWSLLGA